MPAHSSVAQDQMGNSDHVVSDALRYKATINSGEGCTSELEMAEGWQISGRKSMWAVHLPSQTRWIRESCASYKSQKPRPENDLEHHVVWIQPGVWIPLLHPNTCPPGLCWHLHDGSVTTYPIVLLPSAGFFARAKIWLPATFTSWSQDGSPGAWVFSPGCTFSGGPLCHFWSSVLFTGIGHSHLNVTRDQQSS